MHTVTVAHTRHTRARALAFYHSRAVPLGQNACHFGTLFYVCRVVFEENDENELIHTSVRLHGNFIYINIMARSKC